LAAALAYLAMGFSVIPLMPESKLPAAPWADFQERLPTVDELGRWFGKGNNNLGLVMGLVSDNTFALDFDDLGLARFALDLHRLARETFVQETPRGVHVLLRTNGEPIKMTSYHGRGLPLDLKAEGGYIVVAPSVLQGGKAYRMLSADPRVATIEKESLDALLARLRTGWPIVQAVLPYYEVGRRQKIVPHLAAWLRERGFSRDRVIGFVRALGRVVADPEGEDHVREAEDAFTRPEKEVSEAGLGEDLREALNEAVLSMNRRLRLPQLTVQAHFDDDGAARPPEGL